MNKKQFDYYINMLLKESFGLVSINENDMLPKNFNRKKLDEFDGERKSWRGPHIIPKDGIEKLPNKLPHTIPKEGIGKLPNKLPHTIDAFPFHMKEYRTSFEGKKNIYSFLEMLKNMDDARMKKNIDILANTMFSAEPNTHANRDFNKKYKQNGITTKEQLVQAITKEVMDRKNYRPDPNM
jgi:hypothetical protein